jgi:hypothetical protein
MKKEYIEGPKAQEAFEPTMTALFSRSEVGRCKEDKEEAPKRQGQGRLTLRD